MYRIYSDQRQKYRGPKVHDEGINQEVFLGPNNINDLARVL